ncbi:MAG: hypothetical protein MUF25_11220 [Pirellulaceae bacterium]|nr:hypothetical protein [Pirellulaceae bacterium]
MSWLDWLVLAAYGSLMLGVGLFFSRRNKTAEDYLLGGRRMSPIALGLSLFATLVSTLSYLGNPGEMIANGPMMTTQLAAHPLIFVIVGYGLIPLLMRQPVTSAYEILESRLGMSIRRAGAGVFLLLRFGWLATILFATARVVLLPLLGLDPWWTPWLCVALGVLTATYRDVLAILPAARWPATCGLRRTEFKIGRETASPKVETFPANFEFCTSEPAFQERSILHERQHSTAVHARRVPWRITRSKAASSN